MKTSALAAATFASVAIASKGGPSGTTSYGSHPSSIPYAPKGGQSGTSYYDSYPSSIPYNYKDCPFIPNNNDFVLYADNIQTVSQVNPNQAFLRSSDLYVLTSGDLAAPSTFTVPDFALGAMCSLNLVVPTPDQIFGDTDQTIFSGGGNLNFSRINTNFPSSGLTFNTLGSIQNVGVMKVVPGQLLVAAPSFPCPPPGTQLNGIIQSVDTTLVQRDTLGPVCPSGFFVLIQGVGNPPVSPPPPASSSYAPHNSYTSYNSYSSEPTYTSKWSS